MAKRTPSINLLHQVNATSSVDKILSWALSVGRWIVILTEIVVIGAFIWRFSLDIKLTNLNEDIEMRKNQVKAFASVEEEFRVVQKSVNSVAQVVGMQPDIQLIFNEFNRSFPRSTDITINQLKWSKDKLSIKGESVDERTISIFENNFRSSPVIDNVNLTNVSLKVEENEGATNSKYLYEFSLTADIKLK